MHSKLLKIPWIAAVLTIVSCLNVIAQSDDPVRIEFDYHSKRIDMVTGKALPNYTQAQRGSFQFFFGRLDTPDNFFWYYFDGRRNQYIDNVALMRKMQPQAVWAIFGTGGRYDSPGDKTVRTNPITMAEIQHHAVSFIPLNPATKKPDPRVYVLIEDMNLIQFVPVNHWLATIGQKEYESEKGKKF
jgi:hypothetical protein